MYKIRNMNIDGSGRPYTAEEWEAKLCKGENSLLAQKKRKIKERAEKGVPDLEAPMRTSRVIKATPPKEKEREKYYFIFRGNPSRMYEKDGDVFIMTPDQLLAPDFRHRLNQTIGNNNREKQKENKSRKGTMASQLQKNEYYEGDNADRVAGIAQETFKDQSTLYNFKMGYEYTVDTLKRFAKKVSADEYENLKKEGRIFEKGLDKWALGGGLSSNDTIKGGSMDRLRKLLDAHPVSHQRDKKDTQGLSREAERTQLNTADARFNKQVYQWLVLQLN